MSDSQRIWVAVGIIENTLKEVFICRRSSNKHQGNKWEFPGGKVETNEEFYDALVREFREEVGIEVRTIEPFLEVQYDYPDKKVLLDAWRITHYEGQPHGQEGQLACWCPINELKKYTFPDANRAFIERLLTDHR